MNESAASTVTAIGIIMLIVSFALSNISIIEYKSQIETLEKEIASLKSECHK